MFMRNADRNPSSLKRIRDAIRRFLGWRPPSQPGDPYAYAMAPLRRGPKGRSGAAVAKIEKDSYRSFPPRRR
jgi:hypothetical protein